MHLGTGGETARYIILIIIVIIILPRQSIARYKFSADCKPVLPPYLPTSPPFTAHTYFLRSSQHPLIPKQPFSANVSRPVPRERFQARYDGTQRRYRPRHYHSRRKKNKVKKDIRERPRIRSSRRGRKEKKRKKKDPRDRHTGFVQERGREGESVVILSRQSISLLLTLHAT